jgi:hypothetical protein
LHQQRLCRNTIFQASPENWRTHRGQFVSLALLMALVLTGDFRAKHEHTTQLPISMLPRIVNPFVFTGFFALETQKAGTLPTGLVLL